MMTNSLLFNQPTFKSKLDILAKKRVFIGFDGFIDSIVSPIKSGSGTDIESMYCSMKEFGEYIVEKSSVNSSIEMVEKSVKIGGNAPITANAVSGFGVSTTCIGSFGKNNISPHYKELSEKCDLISIGEPGTCLAVEIGGVKLMLATNNSINNISWQYIADNYDLNTIKMAIDSSDLLCFLNWSELPGSTSIFEGILDEVLCKIKERKHLLIDLSDCSRRNDADIYAVLDLIKDMSEYADITLSLNKNERNIICHMLGILDTDSKEQGNKLISILDLHAVYFHNIEENAVITKDLYYTMSTPKCEHPKIMTGAGDNFNAGICIGLLSGSTPQETLEIAINTACFYVENGYSYKI